MRRWIPFLLLLALLPTAHALGLAQEYHVNDTIAVQQGSNYLFRIEIQNPGPEDIAVNVSLVGRHVTIDGANSTFISIPARTQRSYHHINISIPEYVPVGQQFKISYNVRLQPPDGSVPVGLGIGNSFTILVTEPDTIIDRVREALGKGGKTLWGALTSTTAIAIVVVLIAFVVLALLARQGAIGGKILAGAKQAPTTPRDLALVLESMTDQEYVWRKAQLASWVKDTIGNASLAQRVGAADTRQEAITILKSA